jgi:pimaricinolide synthase PimS1
MPPMSADEGMRLLDAAIAAGDEPVLVPVKLDLLALRQAPDDLPAMLRQLVTVPRRPAAGQGPGDDAMASRLAGLPEAERHATLLEMVQVHAAAALGYPAGELPDENRAFFDLGFDSLTAVELRNKLSAATGAQLPATIAFEQPTAADLADYLHDLLLGESVRQSQSQEPLRPAGASDEQVAIVGMACRFPGGVASPHDLWELVAAGRDGICPFPDNRSWDMDYWREFLDTAGKPPEGGFVPDATDFDAEFFGISPNEATMMDPQQRLLLEACWEALDSAGIDPSSLKGTATGVFAGVMESGYDPGTTLTSEHSGMFRASGALASMVSGRIAYSLGLAGPAVSIDTAC